MSPEALPEPTSKAELLAQFDSEYADYMALLMAIPASDRSKVWDDGRTYIDMITHIADWEAYALARIQNGSGTTQTPPRIVEDSDLDVVNAQIHERYAEYSWNEAIALLEKVHGEMRAWLETMPEEDIFDPERVTYVIGEPDQNVLWMILGNTSGHYREHADELRSVA